MIPLTVPLIGDDDLAAVEEVLRSGMLVQGARVAEFERLVAAEVGTEHAVAVSSGTAALHVALLALGVGPGATLAVPTYSWPATANVVELVGARVRFVDIDPDTWAMDPQALAAVDEPLAAVIPVHPFGAMADLPALAAAAPGVPVVEDAACALGASRDGASAGSVGELGCFSFHPRKAVTTAEGGMVTTSSSALAADLRRWRAHGMVPGTAPTDFDLPGLNYRLTEMQGALGITQMAKLHQVVDARRAGAAVYDALLESTVVRPPVAVPGSEPVLQSYVAVLPEGTDRARLIAACADQGVQTQIGTIPIPFTSYYREKYGLRPEDFPVTRDREPRALTLPLFPGIAAEQQQQVVDVVLAAL